MSTWTDRVVEKPGLGIEWADPARGRGGARPGITLSGGKARIASDETQLNLARPGSDKGV